MGFLNGFLTKSIGLGSICEPRTAGVHGKVYLGDFDSLYTNRSLINVFGINANGDTANVDLTLPPFDTADLVTIEGTNIDVVPITNISGMANTRDRFEHALTIRAYGEEQAYVREQINRLASGRFFAIVVDGETGEERTIRIYGATAGLTVQGGELNNMNDGEFGGSASFTLASSEEYGLEGFYPQLFVETNSATIEATLLALDAKVLP